MTATTMRTHPDWEFCQFKKSKDSAQCTLKPKKHNGIHQFCSAECPYDKRVRK